MRQTLISSLIRIYIIIACVLLIVVVLEAMAGYMSQYKSVRQADTGQGDSFMAVL